MSSGDASWTRADKLRALRRSLSQDLRWGSKSIVVNSIGGSDLVPRVLRTAILRGYGADVETHGINAGCTFNGKSELLHIGAGTFINSDVFIESVAPVHIGRDVALAMGVMIITSDHALGADGRWERDTTPRPVTIGDQAWIGARAIILPGTTVGEGTIVAAGAVVTRDCEPWSLYAGVPARRIRGLRDGDGDGSTEPR